MAAGDLRLRLALDDRNRALTGYLSTLYASILLNLPL